MKFRKRVKVFPGFYLNFSNSGVSSTIGVRGASINFSKKGTYLNTGIPGTGFYDRKRIDGGGQQSSDSPASYNPIEYSNQPLPDEIKSADSSQLTSTNLIELKATLNEAYNDRIEISNEFHITKRKLKSAKRNRVIACIFIIGFFIKSLKNKILELDEYLKDLNAQYNNCYVDIDNHFDNSFKENYEKLVESYKLLLTTEVVWDITSSIYQDTFKSRSAASTVVTRTPVKFKFDNIEIIKSSYPAFHFENKNGGDLYIYPAFVIITNNKKEFGLIDIKEFMLYFSASRFLEEQRIPSDTVIIDKTWAKVNKNGSPDRRFANNYEIPIVRYGEISIQSSTGLNETYSFSNYEKSEYFAKVFNWYKNLL